ncbi:MAG: hypothetical protein HY077_12695 [Elusimicrobia bacterium]|nr:hypothetical protein [Elusimicrobiota bacterium]
MAYPAITEAKIQFTGYGDFQATAHTGARIYGSPPALATFKINDATSVHSRGFNVNNVGLFATTNLRENMNFLVDLTYRQIANTVKEIRVQYAYLEHFLPNDYSYRAGKITLPFGYYNQNRFYAFQRVELTAPVFQSAILGLPIADVGASGQKRFPTQAARIDVDVYAVNGYGGLAADPQKFRSPTLPGALAVSGNLAAADKNGKPGFGGRVTFAEIAGRKIETGVSYYVDAWNPAGSKYFQMWNGHFHAIVDRLDLVAEYLHLDVSGDAGFAAAVGDTHWKTDGYFATVSYPLWKIQDMPLTPFASSEWTYSRGHHNGGGQEKLSGYRAGLALQPWDMVRVKLEYGFLNYVLPLSGQGDLRLDIHSVIMGLVVTF